MRVLITGSNGMLGSELVTLLGASEQIMGLGLEPNIHAGLKYAQCDVRDREAVHKVFREWPCDWVIHTAAFTDVDACEKDAEFAFSVNAGGSRNVAEAVEDPKAKGLLISTDYVFDGQKASPYEESDTPHPLSVYGRSKWLAERYWQGILKSGVVLRTSWLFGRQGKDNFVNKIASQALPRQRFAVVCDQWGSPTWAKDLARGILRFLKYCENGHAQVPNKIHFCNSGSTSRYEWACFIVREMGGNSDLVKPIRTQRDRYIAPRPARGMLSTALWKKIFKEAPRDIWSATRDYIDEELRAQESTAAFRAHS